MAPIVILGASFAGVPLAHHLLNVLPNQKVILVNPSTHFYFVMASPRAILGPDVFGKNQPHLHTPIAAGFARHASRFEFVQGKAVSIVPNDNTVVIQRVTDENANGAEIRLEYSHLVIATGAGAVDGMPFKQTSTGTLKDLQERLAALAARIEATNTILLAGAGPTGVETAGEIASRYPGKKIILVSSDSRVLPMAREDVGNAARKCLEKLGVEMRWNSRVTEERKSERGSEIVLSSGESIDVDVYIPTYGLSPNTGFVSQGWLDAAGWVVTDEYLRVPATQNVWALGDVTHWGNRGIMTIDTQLFLLAGNLRAALEGTSTAKWKKYKHSNELMTIVPVGPRFAMGTGYVFGWRVWGWVVWMLKGRKLGIDKAAGIVQGRVTATGKKV